jgi:hypothetical protein
MSVAHSSAANTAVSLGPRRFGMWGKSGGSPSQQNYEPYLRANSGIVGLCLPMCFPRRKHQASVVANSHHGVIGADALLVG